MGEVLVAASAVVIVAGVARSAVLNRPVVVMWRTAVISAGGVLAMGILYVALMPIDFRPVAIAALGIGGVLSGTLVGWALPLDAQVGVVMAHRVAWLGAPYGIALAAAQITGLSDSADWFVLAVSGVLAAAAMVTGGWIALMLRRHRIGLTSRAIVLQAVGDLCPECGTTLSPAWEYCASCGAEPRATVNIE